ncbi:MAG: alpha-E domain-containing protein [Janthinobacterium lividum]
MLSRTADHLFWMSRYTERAENTARMLDVNVQTALLPQTAQAASSGWRALLGISELESRFDAKYPTLTARDVIDFMVRDPSNPSSIAACLKEARENARAVRGTLTTECWESMNITWLELGPLLNEGILEQDPGRFFEWVKHRSHQSRGVTIGTMLKDEAFYFIRLGTHLERADNTARMLDVKFHGAMQEAPPSEVAGEETVQGQQFDYYYWAAILRSVSAFEIYRKVYRDAITPARVAELLMLRADMPRSLLSCLDEVVANLKEVGADSAKGTERFAGKLHASLKFNSIEDILKEGLHDYLKRFLKDVFELGNRISSEFLVPVNAAAPPAGVTAS